MLDIHQRLGRDEIKIQPVAVGSMFLAATPWHVECPINPLISWAGGKATCPILDALQKNTTFSAGESILQLIIATKATDLNLLKQRFTPKMPCI